MDIKQSYLLAAIITVILSVGGLVVIYSLGLPSSSSVGIIVLTIIALIWFQVYQKRINDITAGSKLLGSLAETVISQLQTEKDELVKKNKQLEEHIKRNCSEKFIERTHIKRIYEETIRSNLINCSHEDELLICAWVDQTFMDIFLDKNKLKVKSIHLVVPKGIADKTSTSRQHAFELTLSELSKIEGFSVKQFPLAHGRIIINPTKFVIIGSGDLNGESTTKNWEAGIISTNPITIEAAKEYFNSIWELAQDYRSGKPK